MNKLVSKNPILRFKLGKKILKMLNAGTLSYNEDYESLMSSSPKALTKQAPLSLPNKFKYKGNIYSTYKGKVYNLDRNGHPISEATGFNLKNVNGKWINLTPGSSQTTITKTTISPSKKVITAPSKTATPVTKRTITSKQPSMFMGVKAGGWNKSIGNIVNLTLDLMNLLNNAGIKYGNALELLQGLNKYLSSNGINASILEDNKWGNLSKRALDFVLNRLNLDGTQRFDNNAPEQVIQAISPVLSVTTFPTTDFKPQIQNVRNNSYNRADIRSLINQVGFNAYDFSGALRKALRKYLNGESNDTTLLDGTDLARFTLPYRKQGGLISRNPILRFKSNFR